MTIRRVRGSGAIYQDQRGYWTVAVPLPPRDGKRRRAVWRFRDRVEAETYLRDIERSRAVADAPAPVRFTLDCGRPTVGDWFEYWLAECVYPHLRPRTADGYRSAVHTHILPGLNAARPLHVIRASDIRNMQRQVGVGRSATTVRNVHVIAARAFDAAVREEVITRNPVRLIERPRPARPHLDVPTTAEVKHLLDALTHRPDGLRWMTYILTGARRGEVVGLEVDRVSTHIDISWQLQTLRREEGGRPIAPPDFEYRHLYGGLFLTRPKSRAGWRVVPLIRPILGMMEQHLAAMDPNPWGLVFTRNGRPIDPNLESRLWKSVQRDLLGTDRHVRLHDLRHAAVDLLYDADVPEDLIIELVGHSTRAMSRSYKSPAHRERLSRAMASVDAFLA